MLIDKDLAIAAINALPDATPVVSADPLQAQLDAANAKIVEVEKKNSELQASLDALSPKEAAEASAIEKAKADLAV